MTASRGWLLALLASLALPDAASAIEVVVASMAGGCPSAEEVEDALRAARPLADLRSGERERVDLVDEGEGFRVATSRGERRFDDPARRCPERARMAAVFALLALDPPSLPAILPPPAHVEQRTYPETGRWPRRIDLELFGMAQVPVVGGGASETAGGGGLRLGLGESWLGLYLGVSAFASSLPLLDGQIRLVRVPIEAGARARWARGRVEGTVDLGLSAAVVIAGGSGYATNQQGTGVEVGFGLSLGLRVQATPRIAPLLGLHVLALPVPTVLTLWPGGWSIDAPQLWVGLSLGLAVRAR